MTATAEERWAERVAAWQASGLSVAAYARQEGLNEVTLGTWKRRLKARVSENVSFVEVAPTAPPPGSSLVVEVRGCRVAVPSDFDEQALVRLLGVLESRQ